MVRAGAFVLTGLAMLAAVALVVVTSVLHSAADRMHNAVESVRAAEQLEVSLLRHSRARYLAAVDPQDVEARATASESAALHRRLDELDRVIDDPAEEELARVAREEVEAYLAIDTQLAKTPGEVHVAADPALTHAMGTLERLVNLNVHLAKNASRRTERWDRVANAWGTGVALMLVGSVVAVLVSFRRIVYVPLVTIRHAIAAFGSGEESSRAPEDVTPELADIARTFNEMAGRLDEQRKRELTFLAGVVHDLKNPLSALQTACALLSPDAPIAEDRLRRTLAIVVRQVGRLNRMASDLLDATRIQAGRLELARERRDLRDLVREAVDLWSSTSEAHELVTVLPADPLPVDCDATRVAQVLNNLLSNAIKYSPGGGVIEIDAGAEAGFAVVSVRDTGVGIAPESLSSIFEPFRRSASRDEFPGVGLGLSVAKRIVAAHGGTLGVESCLNEGSTFTLRLPMAP